ncbi:N-acetylglucosamine-6-phosphate deacetylase [Jatrophihabitans fulvus]
MTLLTDARVVTPSGVLDPGWVQIDGHRIAALGEGPPPADVTIVPIDGAWVLPGFVDLHVHGGGGHDVASSPDDLAAAVAFHRAHGTTRTLISLMTTPLADLRERLGWISELTERGPSVGGHVVGAHLEGPFLASSHCGAQNPAHLRAPDRGELASLFAAGPVRSITLAPELPGGLDLVRDTVAAGVVASVGHTGTGFEDAAAAYDAGARLTTHLGNGMPPLRQREPGPIGAALDRGAFCEVIADGHHLHPGFVRLVPHDRLVLITDAMAATGAGDGDHDFAGQRVEVRDGVARLASTGSLAGSTLTMDAAVRWTVQRAGLPITVAAAAAATNPAAVLGVRDACGALEVGLDADLVVLDADLQLRRVMARGEWCG